MKTDFHRWTARRKADIIIRILRGENSIADVCREHDLKQSEVESWVDTFLRGGENSLKTNAKDEHTQYEREIRDLRAKVGELVLELDSRKKWRAQSQDPEINS